MELVNHISTDMLRLVRNAQSSVNNTYREIFHASHNSKMQFMLIAIAPNKLYDYIRDDQPGFMAFTCLYGTITIRIIETNGKNDTNSCTNVLKAGNILYLPRRYWRETKAGAEGAVFTESIEGEYDPSKRQAYD